MVNPELGRWWWQAEHMGEPPVAWEALPEVEQQTILERILAVIERRVAKDSYSIGDMAILVGDQRPRNPYDVPEHILRRYLPQAFSDASLDAFQSNSVANPRISNLSRAELLLLHTYDAITSEEGVVRRVNMFGNTHIGNYQHTNLQMAGQPALDQPALITGWYLRASPSNVTLFESWLQTVMVTLAIRDAPFGVASAYDLWKCRAGILAPLPARSYLQVIWEPFDARILQSCTIWIHLTGWKLREVY